MMNYLGRLFKAISTYANPSAWFLEALGGGKSKAGVLVNETAAYNLASFHQAVTLISGDIAKFPLITYKNLANGGKERAKKHPAYYLLKYKASDILNTFEFLQVMVANALVHGNSYAFIHRDERSMRPLELLPLEPGCMEPVFVDGDLKYRYKGQEDYEPYEVFHLRNVGRSGYKGASILQRAKESLGLTIAAQQFGSAFFANGATPSGMLTVKGVLTEDKLRLARAGIAKQVQGLDNAHNFMVGEEGSDFKPFSMSNEKAQWLGLRAFQRQEIASWFNLPPDKLGDETHSSLSSLEQIEQNYLNSTLEPWFKRIQMEAWDKLLTESEKRDDAFTIEFQRMALLLADAESRHNIYRQGIDIGMYSRNECRAWENLNPIEGGDEYLVAKNMGLASESEEPAAEEETPTPHPAPPKPVDFSAHFELLEETAAKMIRWEVGAITRATKKPNFLSEVDAFYAEHQVKLEASLVKVLRCVASLTDGFDADATAKQLAADYVKESHETILTVAGQATADNLGELVSQAVTAWEGRAASVAAKVFQAKKEVTLAA